MKYHFIRHLVTITKHRNQVIRNGWHCGIFWHCLRHDLTKYGPTEFITSAKYYAGSHSPVDEERRSNFYFSKVCQHHTKRNKHHWEYWTDFYFGRVIAKQMPYVYAVEYVCDMLSASKTYDPRHFSGETTLNYFLARKERYYMSPATKEFVEWCLTRYRDLGFAGLKKKDTKRKYEEVSGKYPPVAIFENSCASGELPPLKQGSIIGRSKEK